MESPRSTSDSPRAAHRNGSPERSTFEIVMAIADDTKTLLTKEIELAKQEVMEAVLSKAKAAAALVVAGFIGLFVLVFGGLTVVAALDNVLPPWGSRLVVTGAFALLAIVAVLFGVARLKKPGLVPEETKRTLKEEKEWAITQLQR
jgi:hypothetical protein